MSFIDALIPPEEQQDVATHLFPWLKGQPPAARPPMAAAQNPPAGMTSMPVGQQPFSAVPAAPKMSAVSLGASAPQPAPAAPMQPVSLGSSMDANPAMPKPPAKANPTGLQKLEAVGMGALGGVQSGVDFYKGVQNAPVKAYDEANKREEDNNKAILAQRTGDASILRSEAESRNLNAEADARLNPQPKTRPVVIADENGSPIPALQNMKSGAVTDEQGVPIINAKLWEKPTAAPKLSESEQAISDEIKGNPQKYPGGDIASNRAKARRELKVQDRAPDKASEEDKAINDYIAANKLPNTPESRVKARNSVAQDKKGPSADEQRRGDLSTNLKENLDALEGIVDRSPELFGPLAGRLTTMRSAVGTGNTDIAALEQIKEQLGMAMVSAHGMRSGQIIEQAAHALLNGFHNQPAALKSAIAAARASVQTFTNDVQRKEGGSGPTASGGGQAGAQQSSPGTSGGPPPQIVQSWPPGRHTLRNGQVWEKKPDGTVAQVQ